MRAQFGDTGATGSAFFISDQLLVTNDHLVSGPGGRDPASVTIENKALGKRVPARILARTHAKRPGDADLALLEVPANTSRAFLRPAGQPQTGDSGPLSRISRARIWMALESLRRSSPMELFRT